jgi:hypothetical protein
MISSIRHLSKRLADSSTGYFVAFAVGVVLLLIMLFYNDFNLQTLYVNDLAMWLLSISGVVMKFLSGFGVMLTYASMVALTFHAFAEQVKGSRKRLSILKGVLILPIFAILTYAVYTLVNALVFSQSLTIIENLTAIYGVWSLMLLVYIVPIALGDYNPRLRKRALSEVGKKVGDMKHSVWRGYQSYIWRDYGRVYSVEFQSYRENMDEIRAVLSGVLLWPIAFLLMLFPPLSILSVMLWFRILSLDYKPFSGLERAFLISIISLVLLITTYLFITGGFVSLLIHFDVSYAIGMFFSIALLGIVIWQS